MRWLVLERGPIAVVCNLGREACWIPLETARYRILLANDTEVQPSPRGIMLAVDRVAIVEDIAPKC